MIIQITTEEAEGLRYACLKNTLNYRVLENNIPGIVKVSVTDSGKKISAALAYRLKGIADQWIREQKAKDEYEREIARIISPNNIVTIIEELPR
jgi:hypothetical protein